MQKEEIQEFIKEAKNRLGHFSREDKSTIRSIIKEYNIEGVKFNGNCSNCYNDAFFVINNYFNEDEKNAEIAVETKSGYTYKRNKDTIFKYNNQMFILNENTDVAVIELFIGNYPNQKYYIKNTNE